MKINLTTSNVPRLLLVWTVNVAALCAVVTSALDGGSVPQLTLLLERVAADPSAGLPLMAQLAFARWLGSVRGEQLVMSVLSYKAASLADEIGQTTRNPS